MGGCHDSYKSGVRVIGLSVLLTVAAPSWVWAQEAAPRFDDRPAVREPAEPIVDFSDPWRLMQRGGLLMWPILLCSFIVATFALERFISLRRGRIIPGRFVRQLRHDVQSGAVHRDQAMARCRTNGSPAAMVILAALRRWGRPLSEIEQSINEGGQREVASLRRNLRALSGTASLATLLGLLGTVIGMILAFNEVASASGQPQSERLATGIAQALLTTAFGLAVAIPALFLHSYFSGRVDRLVYELDQTALSFGELVGEEAALASQPASPAIDASATFPPVTGRPTVAKMNMPRQGGR